MKKICSICNKSFQDDTNNFQCKSCLDFREYKEHYSVPKKPIEVLPELHFDMFSHGFSSYVKNRHDGTVLGSCQYNSETGIYHVRIDLYALKGLEQTIIEECIRLIIHENDFHACIGKITDPKTMSDYDNIDYLELESWLRNK